MRYQVSKYVTYKSAKVGVVLDREDEAWFDRYTWTAGDNGCGTIYVHRKTKKSEGGKSKRVYLHRALTGAAKGEVVDHINRNPLDNRRSNLRIASSSVNNINRGKNKTWRGKPTSSRYKGVSWNKKVEMWQSYICRDYKIIYLGYFTDEKDAARAYDEMAFELYGDCAYLNFPRLDMAV
jgi:HNH endonuclease/AP2 domain